MVEKAEVHFENCMSRVFMRNPLSSMVTPLFVFMISISIWKPTFTFDIYFIWLPCFTAISTGLPWLTKQFLGPELHSGVFSKAEGILPLMVVAFVVFLLAHSLSHLPKV